ncbi:hypothetical protein Dimus_025163 [Dionaea muscipula]
MRAMVVGDGSASALILRVGGRSLALRESLTGGGCWDRRLLMLVGGRVVDLDLVRVGGELVVRETRGGGTLVEVDPARDRRRKREGAADVLRLVVNEAVRIRARGDPMAMVELVVVGKGRTAADRPVDGGARWKVERRLGLVTAAGGKILAVVMRSWWWPSVPEADGGPHGRMMKAANLALTANRHDS